MRSSSRLFSYVGALVWWLDTFKNGLDDTEVFVGALWSILVSLMFPLVWFGLIVLAIVKVIQHLANEANA